MNTEFDYSLEKIENLKWLPFVGKNYSKQTNKVLLVGESHYSDSKDPKQNIQKPLFTRWIVNELGIGNRDYKADSNFFKTINKMFANNDLNGFWNKISFLNFVQRPMIKTHSENERPTNDDFKKGWEIFFHTVRILKPDFCLFLGNTCGDKFNSIAAKLNITHNKVIRLEKINGAYLKYGTMNINEHEIKLYFIKHPSQYFTSNEWIEALKLKNENLIKALCE
jgi:hypothetical protein